MRVVARVMSAPKMGVSQLFDRVRKQGIDRREFLQMSGGVAGLSLLGKPSFAQAQKQGGHLRQAIRGGAVTDTLDGATLIDTHNVNTSNQIRNTLSEILPDGTVTGELAEVWETKPGAKEWVCKLRNGVEFHNGKSLAPTDVIYSINHHRAENSGSGGAGVVEGIEDIRTDGPNSVVFTLKDGNVDFPYLMADYHLVIVPEGTSGTDWAKGVGTGPFVLERWEPGVVSAAVRNPNYFKEGRPYFDSVESFNVPDLTARVNALQTGEVDVIDDLDKNTVGRLGRLPGVRIVEAEGGLHMSLPMRTDVAPFDNNDIRLAMKYSVDREAILDRVLGGHGYLGADQPIGRNSIFYNPELKPRPYDPEKAKFHLKKAGMDALKVKLVTSEIYTGAQDVAVLFGESAKASGITVDIERYPVDGYWNDIWMKRPFSMVFWFGRPTADWMLSTVYATGSAWNDTFWSNAAFDKLLKEARVELDEAKRREMYFHLQDIVSEDCGAIIPVFSNLMLATNEKIALPATIAGDSPMDGQKNAERWSFA